MSFSEQDITIKKPALSSLWDGLSPHLIASIYQVNSKGERVDENVTVKCPVIEGNLDIALNWQSPFESSGVESKAPMLFAMLQSGALQPVVDALNGKGVISDSTSQKSTDFLKQFEGRTGITKLNSTQVFSGTAGAKIQITVLFRAWRNATQEVETPINQLMAWALPVELAGNSTLVGRAISANGIEDAVDVLLPSKSPVMVALKYKNRTFSPLVIESIGYPLTSPIDSGGNYVEMSIPLSLSTLTAIDRADWQAYKGSKPAATTDSTSPATSGNTTSKVIINN